jgi:hypothetical protein
MVIILISYFNYVIIYSYVYIITHSAHTHGIIILTVDTKVITVFKIIFSEIKKKKLKHNKWYYILL